jgi:hypothetical protein
MGTTSLPPVNEMDSAASGIMLEATATQGRDASGSYEGVIAPVQPAPKVATPEEYSFVIEDILRMPQELRSKDWLAEELSVRNAASIGRSFRKAQFA